MRPVTEIATEAFAGVVKDSIERRLAHAKHNARLVLNSTKRGIRCVLCRKVPELETVFSYDPSFDSLSIGYDSPADMEDLPPARRPSLVTFSTEVSIILRPTETINSSSSWSSSQQSLYSRGFKAPAHCPYDATILPYSYRPYDLDSTSNSSEVSFHSCFSTQLAAEEAILESLCYLFEEPNALPQPLRSILKKPVREPVWTPMDTDSIEDALEIASCCSVLRSLLRSSLVAKDLVKPAAPSTGLRSLYLHDNVAIDEASDVEEEEKVLLKVKLKLMVKSTINDFAWSTPVQRMRLAISLRLDQRAGKWPVKNRRPADLEAAPWHDKTAYRRAAA